MGKTKRLDEIFSLKKELRECHETISTLEKQLVRYQKEQSEPKLSKAEKKKRDREQKETVVKKDKCPECSQGDIVYADLGVRELVTCSKKCGFRQFRKVGKNE